MRILFLTNSLERDNGGGVFSRQVIEGITKRLGAHATIFTIIPSDDPTTLPIKLGYFGILRTLWRIRTEAKHADVLHVFDIFPHGILASLATVGLRKKMILTAIGSASIIPLSERRYASLARWSLRRAALVTAISNFTQSEILKKIPSLQMQVINPGIHLAEYTKALAEPLKAEVQKVQPYILSVGTVRWRKGYRRSVATFAEIAAQFPKLSYVIIGRHPWPSFVEELKGIAEKKGVGNRLIFLDSIDTREELLAWYRGAELFCLFSENADNDIEGFGIVFVEAAAMGLPVVGRKNCGVDDAVADGGNGTLVTSPEEFKEALRSTLSDLEKAGHMREESLKLAKRYSVDDKTDEYVALYRSLGVLNGSTLR
ncbi:MAG TPA: glycosyltransferase family 4 protein [Candidatus Paceibacterota bacterium]